MADNNCCAEAYQTGVTTNNNLINLNVILGGETKEVT